MASLSSGLLARKGQARPAMRPQGFVGMTSPLDDLGWNDMGGPAPMAEVSDDHALPVDAPVPSVVRQREALEQEWAAVPEPVERAEPLADARVQQPVESRPVPDGKLNRIDREVRGTKRNKAAAKGKAAFTLRLDADRHLRLRLASAVRNRSAQQLVTEALDAYLATVAEVDPLIDRLDGVRRK
ncbi:hypothetical protein [Sphingomonas sp.]